MAVLSIILGVLLTLTLIHCLNLLSAKLRKLPPGPTPLPIIGNLHLLGDQPHISLAKLAKTYGPIMCVHLGQISTLVISSSILAKQVLQKQDLQFSSRSIPAAVHGHNHFQYSVVFLPVSARWCSLRKIMNSQIFSSSRLDSNHDLRCQKVQELIANCKKSSQTGEAVDIGRAAFRTSLNLVSNTVFSKDITDPFSDSAKQIKNHVRDILLEVGKPNLADFFPVLQKVDPQGIQRNADFYYQKLLDVVNSLIDEKLEQRKSGNHANNDVMDLLLTISQENPEEMDRNLIEHMCIDLFIGGTDTTSSTVEWAMTELLRNPRIMNKAKAELDETISKGKTITEADIPNLPYLKCIIKETFRLHPPAPFLVPRRVEQEVELCGYTVPKNSQVLINVWAIGRDPVTWENPLEFKPERFLNNEIDIKGKDFELIPFGSGRRICPGLPLAMIMVSVMLGSILNNFEWTLEGGIKPEEMDMGEMFGFALSKAKPLMAVPIPL